MSPKTVLVVDDESHLTYLVSYKLEEAGLKVIIANDGQEGLELAVEHRPALIVTDFQMPVMSGLELCVKLKATPATTDIPVIMVTGRGHRISPSELAPTNIRHLVAKPFSARELVVKVLELLETEHASAGDSHDPQADSAAR